MPSRITLLFASLVLAIRSTSCADSPPNILVILADDFGVGDIQAHYPNNRIATPYLDQLVREGISFTDAHSPSAVCSPTRYGLLTGRYAWRTRLQEWVIAAYEPPLISADRPTLSRFLSRHGYHTACIGKWHLGWSWSDASVMTERRNGLADLKWKFDQPISGGPTSRGFDYYFGVDLPNLPPFTYLENDRVVEQPTASFDPDPDEGVVLPNRFAGSPAAPGWRMQNILPEITRRAVEHVHKCAKQDQPFFLYFSMTSPHEPIVPSEEFRGKSGIAPIADFVMETDWSAGQVIKAIDDAGIADNTIVIFTADNGHSHYTGWNELVQAGHMPSGPYRGHKGDIWEGGHRVPLVIRWPGRIQKQSSSDQLVSLTDMFATCAALIDKPLPENAAEDSFSFLASALGKDDSDARTSLVSHSNMGEFAFRDGDRKLVYRMSGKSLNASRGKPTVAELYNLRDDIAEAKDLAGERPEIVKRMRTQLQQVIDAGGSRHGFGESRNDGVVRFDRTQMLRWAPTN